MINNMMMHHFYLGPLIVLLAVLFKIFPPKRINWLYGYRTSYSMRSQEVWDEANRFSVNLMLGVGIIISLVQLILHFTTAEMVEFITAIILLVVLLIATMIITEIHLRKHFDKDGNRRLNP